MPAGPIVNNGLKTNHGADDGGPDAGTNTLLEVGAFRILVILFSIAAAVLDLGFDVAAANEHFKSVETDPLRFIFTVGVLSLSASATGFLNIFWYYQNSKIKAMKKCSTAWCMLALRVLMSIFSLSSVIRNCEVIYRAWKVNRIKKTEYKTKREHFDMYLDERFNGQWLNMIESLFEAAPQFCVQVTIVLTCGSLNHSTVSIGSILTSMLFVPLSVASCKEALRKRDPLNLCSVEGGKQAAEFIVLYMWRLFEIVPRLIVFALFTSTFGKWIIFVLTVHWIFMFIWIKLFLPTVTESKLFLVESVHKALNALSWILCFLNVQEGPTRKTTIIFYSVFYIENVAMALAWYLKAQEDQLWWHLPALIAICGSIIPMVGFMVIYYKFLHYHNKDILMCSEDNNLCLPFGGECTRCISRHRCDYGDVDNASNNSSEQPNELQKSPSEHLEGANNSV